MGLRSILYESWTYSHADPSSVARFDHVAAFRPPLAGHDEAQPYANPGFRAMAGSHANYALPLVCRFCRVRTLVEPQFSGPITGRAFHSGEHWQPQVARGSDAEFSGDTEATFACHGRFHCLR